STSRIDVSISVLLRLRRPTTSTLFPYTTLFRSPVVIPVRIGLNDRCLALIHEDPDRCRGHRDLPGKQLPVKEHLVPVIGPLVDPDRKSTRLNSSHVKISYAVFCLKKKKPTI